MRTAHDQTCVSGIRPAHGSKRPPLRLRKPVPHVSGSQRRRGSPGPHPARCPDSCERIGLIPTRDSKLTVRRKSRCERSTTARPKMGTIVDGTPPIVAGANHKQLPLFGGVLFRNHRRSCHSFNVRSIGEGPETLINIRASEIADVLAVAAADKAKALLDLVKDLHALRAGGVNEVLFTSIEF